jgi:hypothetical protein
VDRNTFQIFFQITPNLSSAQNKQIQKTAKGTRAVMLVRTIGNRSPMKGRRFTN